MGPAWLEALADWIRLHPQFAGLVAFAIAFFEGFALVGIVVPGILLLFALGALVGLGVLDLGLVWAWTSAGAIVGDAISFWIGHHFRASLRELWPFNRFRGLLDRGEAYFRRHGLKSVILGRFMGPVRPVMPVVAGMLGMDLKRYVPANLIAGVFWAPAYLLPGLVFGASLELAQAVTLRLALLIVLLAALSWLLLALTRAAYGFLAPRTSMLLESALRWSRSHARLGRVTRGLVDPQQPESASLALFALLLLLAVAGLLALGVVIPVLDDPLAMDQATRTFMEGLRSPWADPLMALLAGLGNYRVLAGAVLTSLAWLLWRRRLFAAAHWVAALAVGLGLSLLTSLLLAIRPPLGADRPGELLPLGHVALAVVVYGFFAVLITRELPRAVRRTWPYLVAVLAIGMVAFSRLYFGAFRLSDLLIAALVSAAWVAGLGIAYRTRVRRSFWSAPLATVFFLTLGFGLSVHAFTGVGDLVARYTRLPPSSTVSEAEWRRSGIDLPDRYRGLVDFEYAGAPDDLRRALAARGWAPAPTAGWSIWLELLQPEPTVSTLPLLPGGLGASADSLTLHRFRDPDATQQEVLRLWPSGVRLVDGTPLWLAGVTDHEIVRVAWFFRYWKPLREAGSAAAGEVLATLEAAGHRVDFDGPGGRGQLRIAGDPAGSG